MFLLKEFADFFQSNGLENLIYQFRFRNDDDNYMAMEATYMPEKDALRLVLPEVEDPEIDGYAYEYFRPLLEEKLMAIYNTFINNVEKTTILKQSQYAAYQQIVLKSRINFEEVKSKINSNSLFDVNRKELLDFVLNIESIFESLLPSAAKVVTAPKKNSNDTNKISFGFTGEVPFLQEVYRRLNLEQGDFINKDKTSEKQFIAILTSEDAVREIGQIHFECESRQAAYVLTKMQSYFNNLTWTAIEKSGKFYSKYKNRIKANSLSRYKTVQVDVKDKKAIDKLFFSLK